MAMDVDYEDLKFYARAALVSYKTEDEFDKIHKKYEQNESTILDKYFDELKSEPPSRIRCGDCGFAIAERKTEILIMFPGTRKELSCFYTDFKTDMDIPIVEATFIQGHSFRTHRGFLRRYHQMHQAIWKKIQHFGTNRQYTVVGHSLGAAMAIFLALELKSKGYQTLCVTLAAPKIGDQNFVELAREINPKTIRLIRTNDPLPKLSPIHSCLLTHFGDALTIDQPNDVWLLVTVGSFLCFLVIPSLLLCVLSSFIMMLLGVQLTHSTESYVALVDNLPNRPPIRSNENFPPPTLKCLPQWYPIIAVTIFAYSLQWTKNSFQIVRRHLRKTIPRRLADQALRHFKSATEKS